MQPLSQLNLNCHAELRRSMVITETPFDVAQGDEKDVE